MRYQIQHFKCKKQSFESENCKVKYEYDECIPAILSPFLHNSTLMILSDHVNGNDISVVRVVIRKQWTNETQCEVLWGTILLFYA